MLKRLIVVFVCGLLISACTAKQQQMAMDTSRLAVEVSTFKKYYANVEATIRTKQAEENTFTEEEWRKLLNLDATIDLLISRMDAIVQLDPAALDVADVKVMYEIAKAGYNDARTVIEGKWDEFSPSTQIMLETLDKEKEYLVIQVEKVFSEENMDITRTLTLVAGLMGIAVKMVGISLI